MKQPHYSDDVQQAAGFFRQDAGFHRLLNALLTKYRSLGKVGGTVVIRDIKDEEQRALSHFFRTYYTAGEDVRVSFIAFVRALQKTKFADIDPIEILGAYAGEELVSNKVAKEQNEQNKQTFFARVLAAHTHPYSQFWLRTIGSDKRSRRIMSLYEESPDICAEQLNCIATALSLLPETYERLPVFAQRITGNPHAFDRNTERGQLFVEALSILAAQRIKESGDMSGEEEENLSAIEQENELLQTFHLVRDDILNFVTCVGLLAWCEENLLMHWKHAVYESMVLNVPVRNLWSVTKIKAWEEISFVFIVENPSVFSSLLDVFLEKGSVPPLVCSHGQFKLATWMLLERLRAGGMHMYYAGDYDPEGLQMAQRLYHRYPGQVTLWRYTVEDYQASQPDYELDKRRLKKLDMIVCDELVLLAEEIRKTGMAGYQEGILELLQQDMEQIMAIRS